MTIYCSIPIKCLLVCQFLVLFVGGRNKNQSTHINSKCIKLSYYTILSILLKSSWSVLQNLLLQFSFMPLKFQNSIYFEIMVWFDYKGHFRWRPWIKKKLIQEFYVDATKSLVIPINLGVAFWWCVFLA